MSGSLRVSVQAIRKAAKLAGAAEYEVLEILFADAGRPLPQREAPAPNGPFGTYHTAPKGVFNAEVEGAPVPDTEPLSTETLPDDSRSQSGKEG